MKRIIGILLALVMILSLASAMAENAFNLTGGLAIWAQPFTNSECLKVVNNATNLVVVGEYDADWYIVDLYQSGVGEEGQYGYILKKYVSTSTYILQLPHDIDFYADTWSGKCNAQRYAGEKYTVISENETWLCVQYNKGAPGSAFINKNELWGGSRWYPSYDDGNNYMLPNDYWHYGKKGNSGTYGPNTYVQYEADWYIPQKWSVAIRVDPLSEVPDEENTKLIILHQNDVVHVIVNLGADAYVRYDDPKRDGGFIEGYVATKYWAIVGQ